LTRKTASTPVPLNYVSDLTRIRAELGWQPEIGIEEGLSSLCELSRRLIAETNALNGGRFAAQTGSAMQ
jgi:hypothetical protein